MLCPSSNQNPLFQRPYTGLYGGTIANLEKDNRGDMSAPECFMMTGKRQVMLAQGIVYCASHSRAKLPKHVQKEIALRHLTGPKNLTMLNRLSHCVSCNNEETVDNIITTELFGKV